LGSPVEIADHVWHEDHHEAGDLLESGVDFDGDIRIQNWFPIAEGVFKGRHLKRVEAGVSDIEAQVRECYGTKKDKQSQK